MSQKDDLSLKEFVNRVDEIKNNVKCRNYNFCILEDLVENMKDSPGKKGRKFVLEILYEEYVRNGDDRMIPIPQMA